MNEKICQSINVAPDLFDDWRWQMKNSIRTFGALQRYLPNELALNELQEKVSLPFSLTPYFASLMDGTKDCPIFLQVAPSIDETHAVSNERHDPLGEVAREAAPHLIHRYPDRVLFLVTDKCASYCRFCTRKRFVGQGHTPKKDEHAQAFNYIEKNVKVREIIFSGGDPLVLSTNRIEELLNRAFAIKHIDMVRIHSRMLSFAPMRIDDELCSSLNKFSPLYLVTHFNHPRELTNQVKVAIRKLQEAGVLILNQSVLLKGINDRKETLTDLFRALVKQKVRPYYLHQCDLVEGASHFRVPIKQALELVQDLRGHISGLCMPTFVIDIPGGHGKVALVPNPIVKEDERFIFLKGFDGGVEAYPKD